MRFPLRRLLTVAAVLAALASPAISSAQPSLPRASGDARDAIASTSLSASMDRHRLARPGLVVVEARLTSWFSPDRRRVDLQVRRTAREPWTTIASGMTSATKRDGEALIRFTVRAAADQQYRAFHPDDVDTGSSASGPLGVVVGPPRRFRSSAGASTRQALFELILRDRLAYSVQTCVSCGDHWELAQPHRRVVRWTRTTSVPEHAGLPGTPDVTTFSFTAVGLGRTIATLRLVGPGRGPTHRRISLLFAVHR